MNELELKRLISSGEDSVTEFKEEKAHSDDLASELVAFANTDGGKKLLDIAINQQILSMSNRDNALQIVEHIAYQNYIPSLSVIIQKIKAKKDIVLRTSVPTGTENPYRTNKGINYTRTSSGKRQPSREELPRLYQASSTFFTMRFLFLYQVLMIWIQSILESFLIRLTCRNLIQYQLNLVNCLRI